MTGFVKVCTSGNQKDENGKLISAGCGKKLIPIPYKRRDEDAKTLNALICPKCDAYDAWPRENVK
jgi:hypothetical protein